MNFTINDKPLNFKLNAVTYTPTPAPDPDPEPEPLSFPLQFNFGPSDMADVEGWTSIKFGEFEGNEYMDPLPVGWNATVDYTYFFLPHNRYGITGAGLTRVLIKNLDPLKTYNFKVVSLFDKALVDNEIVTQTVQCEPTVYDGNGNDLYYGFQNVWLSENEGGPEWVQNGNAFLENMTPDENGVLVLGIGAPSDGGSNSFVPSLCSLRIEENE